MSLQRLLVIDDDADLMTVLELSLVHVGGFEVRTALDWDGALSAIRFEIPQLVLLDLVLGPRDGRDLFALLRSEPGMDAVPIVFLTAHGEEAVHKELMELGAAGVLTKPFSPFELPDRVREFAVLR